MLHGGVRARTSADKTRYRRIVYDHPGFISEHVLDLILHASPDALEKRVGIVVPLLFSNLVETPYAQTASGVVEGIIDAPERRNGGAHKVLDIVGNGDVGADEDDLTGQSSRLFYKLRTTVFAPPAGNDVGAVPGEFDHGGAPDTGGGPSDDRCLVFHRLSQAISPY